MGERERLSVYSVCKTEEVGRSECVCPLLQVALSGTQVWWTTEVNLAFSRLEEGYENALKDYYKKQVNSIDLAHNQNSYFV